MRILQTSHSYAPSLDGVARAAHAIGTGLVRLGHEVHHATASSARAPSDSREDGIPVHRFAASEIAAFRRFVQDGGWDVVITHAVHHWAFDSLLEIAPVVGRRQIYVSHGMLVREPAYEAHSDRVAEAIRSIGAWVCLSPNAPELSWAMEKHLPPPVVLQNGVHLDEWSGPTPDVRSRWSIPGSWVVNISNHSPLKGHAVVHALAESPRFRDVRFSIFGASYPMARFGLGRFAVRGGCWYRCRARAVRSGVELRSVPREAVVAALRQADVLIAPSEREANSIVLLEAMAAGTPWISYDVGAAACNAGGIVVRHRAEMSDALEVLLSNASYRAELGSAGRARVAEAHDWDRIVKQYESLACHVYETTQGIGRT